MNIDFYFDVPPNTDFKTWDFEAYSNPIEKAKGWTRYKISVNIPDPNKPDVVLVGEAEEVGDKK